MKPHTMPSLYLDPIKPLHVEPNVDVTAKSFDVMNVVAGVETSSKSVSENVSVGNPRSEKTLGQSSLVNVVVGDTTDENVHVSPSKEKSPEPMTSP